MSEAIKPTPGPWVVEKRAGDEWWFGGGGGAEIVVRSAGDEHGAIAVMAASLSGELSVDSDFRLIAEAGTVHHETGLTPRQLVERVKELEEATVDFLEAQGALDHRELMGINAEPYEVLMRRRNAARADLEAALSKALPNTVAEVK